MFPADSYLVSINCMTYNQSAYITDALNGFAIQQTLFPYIAVVIDDASTDGEQEVIRNYVRKHFYQSQLDEQWETEDASWFFARHRENENFHIVVVLLKRNLYRDPEKKEAVVKDWFDTKYVALCEGDDYWIDPLKLQKQVDILNRDESLMAVVTNSKVVDKTGNELKRSQNSIVPANKEGRYDLRSFIYKVHNYPTATVCYRRTHVDEIKWMTKHTANPYLGDWTLWISLHVFGDFYYLDQVTSAYRINPTSVTHTCDRVGRAKANWTICKAVQDILPKEYDDIRKSLDKNSWMWIDLAYAYRHEKEYLRMVWCFFVAFLKSPNSFIGDFRRRKNKRNKINKTAEYVYSN